MFAQLKKKGKKVLRLTLEDKLTVHKDEENDDVLLSNLFGRELCSSNTLFRVKFGTLRSFLSGQV